MACILTVQLSESLLKEGPLLTSGMIAGWNLLVFLDLRVFTWLVVIKNCV